MEIAHADRDITMVVKMGPKSFPGITDLSKGQNIDETALLPLCDFVDARLDCADFRLITLLRVLHAYSEGLSAETLKRLKSSVLGFRYWMDEPGDDSICWWSENHQILFFACQFLAGGLYPDEIFTSSGKKGEELRGKARPRILRWLKRRFLYGFIEWHSNTYYEEDAAPLANLVDFAADEEISTKAAIILDLLLADMAMHSCRGLFSASSGRCYEQQKKHPLKQDTLEMGDWVFGFENRKLRKDRDTRQEWDDRLLAGNLRLSSSYRVPSVIRKIAGDESTAVIKSSMGLNLSETRAELGNLMDIENAGYYLWAMEAFSNPESVKSTMKMFRHFKMRSNDFLKDLKILDIPLLRPLLPLVTWIMNPATDGVAIQRADTYTWRKGAMMLSTAQNHHPGTFGDQQHIWQATLSPELTVFTTHPGSAFFEDNARNFSPGKWVGNSIQPHAVQHENVVLCIYNTRKRRGFLEGKRARFSHAWFPTDMFDEFSIKGRRACGRLGKVMLALIGGTELELITTGSDAGRELIQHGTITWWVCEISDSHSNFASFCRDIDSRDTAFDRSTLSYGGSSAGNMSLRYKGDFSVNEMIQDTDYPRLDSPWGTVKRKSTEISLRHGDSELYLDFNRGIREERTI